MAFNGKQPFVDTANDFTPINDCQVVVPNDSAALPNGTCKALIFQGTGNIRFMTSYGNIVTLVISSAWFGVTYIRAAQVYATGTTISAGSIIACY